MKYSEIFGNAKYVCASENNNTPYLRKAFDIPFEVKSAKLTISVLGFCELYFNGKKITDDLFITTWSQYDKFLPENASRPGELPQFYTDEFGFTVYASEFDVKEFLNRGSNALGILVSGGWYMSNRDKYGNFRHYGKTKASFVLDIEGTNGEKLKVISDKDCKWKESFLSFDSGVYHEEQDERKEIKDFSVASYDDSDWQQVDLCDATDAKYFIDYCPRNKIMGRTKAKLINQTETEKIYALPTNFTGFPVIKGQSEVGDVITCKMGELLEENKTLHDFYCFSQNTTFVSDGREERHLRFTWHGFQFFSISTTGDLSKLYVDECMLVHADIKNTSEFETDNEILNFIYNAYVRSQLQNYQCGVPTDCPQIERRGYTGDGQLLGELGMLLFDSKNLYHKWLNDIADVQDKKTGYVDYTAPSYYGCSGGPGGWSVAIINAPYQYYKRYGDKEVLKKYYPNMLKYLEYMDYESIDGLVDIVHRANTRCLGDWSGPEKPFISDPFVNTCLYVEALYNLIEIAKVIGKEEDVKSFEERIAERKKAIDEKYFDSQTGDYLEGKQGANAFALNIGLGDERTVKNLNSRYDDLGYFDVGIFGLKLLPKMLFANGYQDTAIKLYTSKHKISFNSMLESGTFTLHEAWEEPRSRNHPMYGVAVLWLFEYVLGIRQESGFAGYNKIIINPLNVKGLNEVKGGITLESGVVKVEYKKQGALTHFKVTIPEKVSAKFKYEGKEFQLKTGVNEFEI